MLAFPDMVARDAGWAAFRKDPDWLKLAAMPQYQDNRVKRRGPDSAADRVLADLGNEKPSRAEPACWRQGR